MNSTQQGVDCLILAGGESRRMKRNKALLTINGQSMIAHLLNQLDASAVHSLMIASPTPELFPKAFPAFPHVTFIEDYLAQAYQGPLSGIAQGLQECSSDYLFVLSCDIAQLPPSILAQLMQRAQESTAQIVYAQAQQISNEGLATIRDYPLIALWHKSLAEPLADFLNKGQRKVMQFVEASSHHAELIEHASTEFWNINDQAAFEAAQKFYS